MTVNNVIFSSYGNDSIALIQFALSINLKNTVVLYSDTQWGDKHWELRVTRAEAWVRARGFATDRITSIGMKNLVPQRKGWPRQGIQFCTYELKIAPALEWLERNDPDKKAICLVGIRREESQKRRNFPEFTYNSPSHGGRTLWAPLVYYSKEQRNTLITMAGFGVLPHRSMECFPCINSDRADLQLLANNEQRITEIELVENEMGITSKGKPRTMFRPYRYMGATGIREICRWAASKRGEFSLDDGTGEGSGMCDAGFCPS